MLRRSSQTYMERPEGVFTQTGSGVESNVLARERWAGHRLRQSLRVLRARSRITDQACCWRVTRRNSYGSWAAAVGSWRRTRGSTVPHWRTQPPELYHSECSGARAAAPYVELLEGRSMRQSGGRRLEARSAQETAGRGRGCALAARGAAALTGRQHRRPAPQQRAWWQQRQTVQPTGRLSSSQSSPALPSLVAQRLTAPQRVAQPVRGIPKPLPLRIQLSPFL